MIQTPAQVLRLLNNIRPDNYLCLKFALMPIHEWIIVLEKAPEKWRIISQIKYLPDEINLYLCSSEDVEVRKNIAYKSFLSFDIQEILLLDCDVNVRKSLVRGKGTGIEVLKKLLMDTDDEIVRIAQFRLIHQYGRIDNRMSRCRSRKFWSKNRYPSWMEKSLNPQQYQDNLNEEKKYYQCDF